QPGQVVAVSAAVESAPLVRAVAECAYRRGARFVDPGYFDGWVKRQRIEHADPDTLAYVPPWYGARWLGLGELRGARISIQPNPEPGLLDGLDPELCGRDALPSMPEIFSIINDRSSRWEGARMETAGGIVHLANIPSEEVNTAPDPQRADGIVRSTKPLDVEGAVVRGLTIRFEGGRAVQIEADENAEALRGRVAVDEGAARLGELALVDREGRIGRLETVFQNTLLDENAASHLAFGNAYAISVDEEDRNRINDSRIHIVFMIGGDDVDVTGITREG